MTKSVLSVTSLHPHKFEIRPRISEINFHQRHLLRLTKLACTAPGFITHQELSNYRQLHPFSSNATHFPILTGLLGSIIPIVSAWDLALKSLMVVILFTILVTGLCCVLFWSQIDTRCMCLFKVCSYMLQNTILSYLLLYFSSNCVKYFKYYF